MSLVPAPSAGRDVLGTLLGAVWALGSLICVACLGYLMQEATPASADKSAAVSPDLPVTS
ncbi:hypothetical protein [Streptomyces sp. ITFR-16]|uniref:hypothetical protein n=1 Tax=Streptomyces sp. ITFR-16 TaxID=3075198 RepID=UPI00288B37BA|nr:hypothetical protein [Streptomyces sp. ITFR-16]WNI23502.1 hypothetical protein RLT58_16940 [Streptomyces sp. ITFR-16]